MKISVSVDLSKCPGTKDKLTKCMSEDADSITASIKTAMPDMEKAVLLIIHQVSLGNKVITTGAGASALVAMEMAGQGQETGLPIMVFTNNFATCQPISFAQGTEEKELRLAEYFVQSVSPGDVVIGISASGETGFVYALLEISKQKGAKTIAITENASSSITKFADIVIKSNAKPEGPSSSKIQVTHLAIGHALILTIADLRGIDGKKALEFMLPRTIPNKKMGWK